MFKLKQLLKICSLITTCSFIAHTGFSTAAPVTVQDSKGELTLPEMPKRIVVIGHAGLDILAHLDVEPVGVVKSLLPETLKQYKSEKYAAVGNAKEPDFEAIYSLKPDLIIAEGRNTPVYDKLKAIAPTYLAANENGQYWRDVQKNWKNIAKLVHKEDKIAPIIEDLDKKMKIQHEVAEKSGLTALMILNNGSNLAAFDKNGRYAQIYNEFGFKEAKSSNVKAKQGPHGNLISFEYIADANPDVIFVLDREKAIGNASGNAQKLFKNKLIETTKAAKNNRIIYVDAGAWYLANGGISSTETMLSEAKSAIK